MMKQTQVKAWPEMTEFIPLLSSVSDASSPTSDLFLDFSGCTTIDSCGVTAQLLKILHFMQKTDPQLRHITWSTHNAKEDALLIESIIELGFFRTIRHLHRPSLLDFDYYSKNKDMIVLQDNGIRQMSFKIYHIKMLGQKERRAPLKEFKKHLLENLCCYEKQYAINTRQLITIIYELAKNSADHTSGDAYFGLDVFEHSGGVKIQFLFGDTGDGIKENIKNHLEDEKIDRGKFFSLVEAYYLACQKGFTSKPQTGRNLGVGMSTAIESSQVLGITLSVFDAYSRGVLSNLKGISHSEIRKAFFPAARHTPFCYYGTTRAKKL